MECPECHEKQTVKYGKYKNTQKYRCKICKKIFREKNYVIKGKKEKELASVLLNLLKINLEDIKNCEVKRFKLSSLLPKEKIDEKAFKNVTVRIKKAPNNHSRIECRNPKIVICLTGNCIEIIRLPDYESKSARLANRGITTLINNDAYSKKDKTIDLIDRPE